MNKENKRELKINKVLASMGVVCSILAITIIVLPSLNKAKTETLVNSSKQMEHNYTTTSESNTWDISKNGDGSVIATLDGNGLLTITGSGEMKGWSSNGEVPWYSVRNQIKNVKIENGVTSIGAWAFYCYESLINIVIPESVTSIGDMAFIGCRVTEMIETTKNIMELPELLKRVRNESDILYSNEEFTLTNCVIEDGKVKISEGEEYGKIKINGGPLDTLIYVITYNEWDISKNGDGSVIATLDENGLLTIAGSGEMKSCSSSSDTPWYYVQNQIKNVKIENGVTSIGTSVFERCTSLTSIEIPESVTSIGHSAFGGCSSLTNIEVDENNGKYSDENGVLYTKDKKAIIKYPEGKMEKTYTIINGVTNIKDYAFENCDSLTSIEIPQSITVIGYCAFYGCTSLTRIEIPESVTTIRTYAFRNCSSLISIEIPNSVTSIEGGTFENCTSLTRIEISKSVTNIGNGAFEDCTSLTSIEIPNSVTSINSNAFDGCTSLTNIEVDANNEMYCDDNGILYTKDKKGIIRYPEGKVETTYTIINGVTSIGDRAFRSCKKLTSIEIPSSVTNIGYQAFFYCKNLISIELPKSVTSIGKNAFCDCESLTSIKIPESVTSIGQSAFSGCQVTIEAETTNNIIELPELLKRVRNELDILYSNKEFTLTNCTIEDGKIKISEGKAYGKVKINGGSLNGLIYVFAIAYNEWDISENKDGSIIATLDENGVLTITGSGKMGDWMYNDGAPWYSVRNQIKNIKIESGVASVGDHAFTGSKNLTRIEIPESVTSIGYQAFYGCTSLASIEIPQNVKSIGRGAFRGCTSLTSIEIPQSVTSIGEAAFYDSQVTTNNIIELPELLKRVQNESDILYSNEEITLTNCIIEDGKIKISEREIYVTIKVNGGALDGLIYVITYNKWDISENGNGSIIATLDENGLLTITGSGKMREWEDSNVPWYSVRNQIKNVKIESGVMSIGCNAFSYCETLTSIEIPLGVTSIGSGAFEKCRSLTSIEVSESVTSIGSYAFSGCKSLISIEIPSSVTSIGDYAFSNCTSLRNIEIPSGVTSIGNRAFEYCTSLTSIEVDAKNEKYFGENGVLYTQDKKKIIKYPEGKIGTSYTILSGVTSVEGGAFEKCTSLTSIEIPSSVISIGSSAFELCTSLTSIEIPEGVTSIGDSAFELCTSLTSIEIPEGVTSIGDSAFFNCGSLTSIEIPESVTSIGELVFSSCQVTEFVSTINKNIELPKLLKRVVNELDILYSNKEFTLINCTIEDGKIKISEGENYGTIEINGGALDGLIYVIKYNEWDISENGYGRVIATLDANGLLTIAGSGNMKCWSNSGGAPWYPVRNQIKSVKIENGVTSIGRYAFCGLEATSIEISESVTSIEDNAFLWCTSLTNIEVDANNEKYCDENGVLYTKDKKEIISYPEGRKETKYTIINGVTSIGKEAFQYCSSLTSIEIPSSVTSIGNKAFWHCESMISIEIPESVTSIGRYAFMFCTSLTSIEIPESVTTIGEEAFYGCTSLTNIKIPEGVTSIGSGVFECCWSLISIEVDANNEKYCDENGVLHTKDKKEIISYPAGKLETTYTIINGVTSIRDRAFRSCENLTSIEIPTSLASVGKNAFSGCTSLTNIKIRSTQSKNTIEKIENMNNSYEIIDKEGNVLSDKTETVKTGNRLKLDNDKICTIIVIGDTTGDGAADIKDILAINKHRLNKAELVDEYLIAGDVNGDGIVDIKDILQINKFRLGKISVL